MANADYELCTALLTAILREDHFSNGSFEHRQRASQVDEILKRMTAIFILTFAVILVNPILKSYA